MENVIFTRLIQLTHQVLFQLVIIVIHVIHVTGKICISERHLQITIVGVGYVRTTNLVYCKD
jgi:hypothetical protein